MENYSKYASTIEIQKTGLKAWKELYKIHDTNFLENKFIFRGQTSSKWTLKTSLEILSESFEEEYKDKLEPFLLEEFQRRYHNYYPPQIPDLNNKIEWWSWMQHYGTPTRLLDWTYSYYVAVYFALERFESEESSAVWALNHDWLWKTFIDKKKNKKLCSALKNDKHLSQKENFELFEGTPNILRLSPFFLHHRQSIQEGCFTITGDTKKSFIEVLEEFSPSKNELKKNLFKIIIPKDRITRREILVDLYKMNISRASLFPGLDGFAFSLKTISYSQPDLLIKEEKLWSGR